MFNPITSLASNARALDQFFTRREVAAECIAAVRGYLAADVRRWLWIEPSAGSGAFFDAMPGPKIGLDLFSQRADIAMADFLTWHPDQTSGPIAVVGNPPFGKNSSLARKFLNHAAGFADLVAFILPRTFQKPSFINRINRSMHLVREISLSDDSFLFENQPYAVPTVFQIWEKRTELRAVTYNQMQHPHFAFVAASGADFAFQRVGARAGLVSKEGLQKSAQSHYFLKPCIESDQLFDRLRSIDWDPIKRRTAGNPSIGKGELIGSYSAAFA